ncbi:MAG: fumarylacetoacetate hydrolase family protein [Proteobacteria bacterium]|nr:fumarylacetoacetate hydrolase family protein [Pseudomonadota bacterium]
MRLVSFEHKGADRAGVALDADTILDLSSAFALAGAGEQAPRSVQELIEGGGEALTLLRQGLTAARADRSRARLYLTTDIHWRAPVRRPSKICCLALNNSANADRILSGPKHPAMFIKPASALAGHGEAIVCKPQYGRTHPEPELAVVIGRRAKDVAAADAYAYVFGYTIHNDITSPTMRTEDTFHYRAIHPAPDQPDGMTYVDTWVSYPGRYKCADTFACMGPWLVSADEVPRPHELAVRCRHGERLITEDNTANLFYKVPEVIEFLTAYMTLLPGDIVSMGTALAPHARGGAIQNVDLNVLGGSVSVEIEGLGCLINPVRRLQGGAGQPA